VVDEVAYDGAPRLAGAARHDDARHAAISFAVSRIGLPYATRGGAGLTARR
jgi:hypothetical protein